MSDKITSYLTRPGEKGETLGAYARNFGPGFDLQEIVENVHRDGTRVYDKARLAELKAEVEKKAKRVHQLTEEAKPLYTTLFDSSKGSAEGCDALWAHYKGVERASETRFRELEARADARVARAEARVDQLEAMANASNTQMMALTESLANETAMRGSADQALARATQDLTEEKERNAQAGLVMKAVPQLASSMDLLQRKCDELEKEVARGKGLEETVKNLTERVKQSDDAIRKLTEENKRLNNELVRSRIAEAAWAESLDSNEVLRTRAIAVRDRDQLSAALKNMAQDHCQYESDLRYYRDMMNAHKAEAERHKSDAEQATKLLEQIAGSR
ncbi:hypothetical protein BU16DRAFT_531125 [Lophium mytilinum]|uniref:Uncharacterized protein n=1 Tax=Lophium mytilinum TaxID=390894 RepID=A0A6A6QC17_9PEZI|nr:hypothetical protein BU16DRAFT_531125 [Lophium mytilinum]